MHSQTSEQRISRICRALLRTLLTQQSIFCAVLSVSTLLGVFVIIMTVPLLPLGAEISSLQQKATFPPLMYTVHPVEQIPNWGAMRTPAEWNRSYDALNAEEFVPVPLYDRSLLVTPLITLTTPWRNESIPLITAKLYYSTRYYGAYDVDSPEYVAPHPGIDLKLARGTPIGAIAGGRVHAVRRDSVLGNMVIVEHLLPSRVHLYSIYGHLDDVRAEKGTPVMPGDIIGTVGMTGKTTAPHLHLQVDRDRGEKSHTPYAPERLPARWEIVRKTVHPLQFIERYLRQGV